MIGNKVISTLIRNSISRVRVPIPNSTLLSSHTTYGITARLIKQNTSVDKSSLTPEIKLHLITPNNILWTVHPDHLPFKDPYWAFYWPGGQALSRYLLDNPHIVLGKNVLDIGSGCGASAIAAAKCKATNVVANDIDSVAGVAISLNAALNHVNIEVNEEQLIGTDVSEADCVLFGDMFYDEDFTSQLVQWMHHLRHRGRDIYVGDPGRLCFKKYQKEFHLVSECSVPNEPMNDGFPSVSVWKMK